MAKTRGKPNWLRKHRIWARSHRAGLIALETIAGVVIVAGIALALFLWQLSRGDISMSFLTAPIERAVNAQLAGYRVTIADTVLEKTDSAAGMSVRLRSLRLYDATGAVIAEAPKAAIGINALPLLVGRVVASRIDLIGPRLAVTYKQGGRIAVDVADPSAASTAADIGTRPDDQDGSDPPPAHQGIQFAKAILSGDGNGDLIGLEEVGIREAKVVVVHERLDARWEISNGNFVLTRRDGNLQVQATADVAFGGQNAEIRAQATISPHPGGLHIAGRFDDLVPGLIGRSFESLERLRALDLPVTADFTGDLDDDGTLSAASLTALLKAGRLRPPGLETPGILIEEGALSLRYDAGGRVVHIDTAELYSGRTRIVVSGRIDGPTDPLAAAPDEANSWRYEIEGRNILLASADKDSAPLPVDRVSLSGRYDLATGALELSRGELVAGPAALAITGTVAPGEGSSDIDLSGTFQPMPVKTLKAIWPPFAAPGARTWVAENIQSGEVSQGSFSLRFPAGLLAVIEAGGTIPDEALQLQFGLRNIVTSYLGSMPLIRGGNGHARILGDRFTLEIDKAHVDLPSGRRLDLAAGQFTVPSISGPFPEAVIDVNITGGVSELLELLDHEPLGYPGRVGVSYADFDGRGEVALRLELPLIEDVLLEQVRITAEAELNKLSGAKLFSGRDFTDGVLLVSVKDETLTAKGEVLVDDRPASIVWRLPFEQSESNPARFLVSVTLDDAERRKFGLEFPYLTGPVRFQFAPEGRLAKGGGGERTGVVADLKMATVSGTPFAWSKPAGVPGDLSFIATERASGGYALDRFAIDSDGTKIRGRLVVADDGAVESVRFPEFNLRPGDDVSLSADRIAKSEWHVSMKGAAFDARELVSDIMSLNEAPSEAVEQKAGGDRIVLNAEMERVVGHEGAYLTDVRTNLVSVGGQISRLDIVGRLQGQANFRAGISAYGQAGGRALRVNADDAGAAFRFSGIYNRAEGGVLELDMELPAEPRAAAGGMLQASNFYIRGEPVLTTINAAAGQRGSPPARTQTTSLFFDRLRMPFERRPGLFRLGESVIRGPSVGATMGGSIDFANRRMALSGTFIPAYMLNNLLSRVPVLGDILVGGQDEGLVALSFAITGPTADPTVTVNPLSMVTPGILRKIFNFGRPPVYARPNSGVPESTGSLPSVRPLFDLP